MSEQKALIVMGHGSRRVSANEEFCGYAKQVEAMNGAADTPRYQHVGVAFLELSPLTLMDACKQAVNAGCNSIDVYPVFLTLGKHVGHDIPQQVAELMERFPNIRANLLKHMGTSENLPTLILDHVALQVNNQVG